MNWLISFLFRCRHEHITRVFTFPGAQKSHVACLDCGNRFEYDWKTMRIGKIL